jgi:MFS family permease
VKSNTSSSSPFSALQVREFLWYLLARFGLILGAQMQYTIVGWQIKVLTNDPLSLGLIGLAEAIPFICIAPFAGHIADLFDRKKILLYATSFFAASTMALYWFTQGGSFVIQQYGAIPIYIVIFFTGIARGFIGPSYFALLPQLVSREQIPNAATWSSTVFHICSVLGPATGGLLLGYADMRTAYGVSLLLIAFSVLFILLIKSRPTQKSESKESFSANLSAGIRFVTGNQIVLSALSLDLFAVLFGGATALLPIFATDILHVGEKGFGFLRAAPAFGAVVMAGILAYYPPKKRAGSTLLWSVILFGVCTVLFAVSKNFYLSLFLLAVSGAFDNVSVVVRHVILQLSTPDTMRGRVAAVNGMFIGSSNEIGAFESGVAAKILGVIPSVIFGGCMTIGIVGLVAKISPKLRKMDLQKMQ